MILFFPVLVASEEARELFKTGQKPGSLARQNQESMLSYVSRRRRWWKLLKTLDGSIELSEPMRVELLLELSGLSRQEIIVIKARAPDAKSFESVAAALVEQYSGVHLREGRSLGQPTSSGQKWYTFRLPPKSMGKTYKPYTANAWYYEEDDYHEEDQDQEEDYNEASYHKRPCSMLFSTSMADMMVPLATDLCLVALQKSMKSSLSLSIASQVLEQVHAHTTS